MFSCNTNLLSAQGLSHAFDYLLFDGLDLSLARSQSIAILGTSGTGKSTLLHILSSFVKPNKGRVEILGREISALKLPELEALRRNDIGIIFQQHYLFRGFSALDNIQTSSMICGKPIDQAQLDALGIAHLLNRNALELSGGEQQRVSVARVLVKRPKIIYADEPTGNLDKKTAADVMRVIFNYIKERDAGMFLVTHDEKIAANCDRVMLLEDKKLRAV